MMEYENMDHANADPTIGSCIMNPRQNISLPNIRPSGDECCSCEQSAPHIALLEIGDRVHYNRDKHLLNKFGDPIRLINKVGIQTKDEKTTPSNARSTSINMGFGRIEPDNGNVKRCCPCVGDNRSGWGDPQRATNVEDVDAEILNLSTKYSEESSVKRLRGAAP